MAATIVMAGKGRCRELRHISLLLAIFLVGWIVTARAAPSPLSAEVLPLTMRPRTQSPAAFEIKIHSLSHAPLDGTLKLEAWGNGLLLNRQEIPDLTLIFGTSTQRLLLPPPRLARHADELRARFSTREGVYDLGRFPLAAESVVARQYVIGVCRTGLGGADGPALTWRALRPERLPHEEKRDIMPLPVTSPASFVSDDFPSALGLCVFDLVLLEGPALATLSEKQLAELTTWVEAGGSVCVVAARDLKLEHTAFLDRLGISTSASPPVEPASDTMLFRQAGLGRVVVASSSPANEEALMSDPWIRATHFLAHSNSRARLIPTSDSQSWTRDVAILQRVESSLLEALPHTARLIPLPVLSVILGAFVLIIGPGEWLVLGRLRRRRWTWVTFPLIALGCTLLTVRAAEHYLGVRDQRVSLVIWDFSPQGATLRENRLDLWFAGRNQKALSEKHQALAVPCLTDGSRRSRGTLAEAPLYQGRVPGHYTLEQPLSQWTPYIERTLTFVPRADVPRLHWEALRAAPPIWQAMGNSTNEHPDVNRSVAATIGAEDWTVHVFQPPFGEVNSPSLSELLSIDRGQPWTATFSPSGRPDLLDLRLDYGPDDLLVVAERHVGSEIQIERCVYHFGPNE